MGVDSITSVQHSARKTNVQLSARNTSFLKNLIEIYIGKKLAKNRAQMMTLIQQGEDVKCFDCMLSWAVLQSILKMRCVLDSSPICLTKVRIKMLMIMYYRCSLAANIFETVEFCLVKMCLKRQYFFIPLHVP